MLKPVVTIVEHPLHPPRAVKVVVWSVGNVAIFVAWSVLWVCEKLGRSLSEAFTPARRR